MRTPYGGCEQARLGTVQYDMKFYNAPEVTQNSVPTARI